MPLIVTLVAFVAVTVNVDEFPALIVAGVATRVTVAGGGGGAEETVTVAVALALPPLPEAFAVYVVVVAGVTDCVPPVAARVKLLPSEPARVTAVALLADTVNMVEAPALMEAGLAETVTVGFWAGGGVLELPEPHPERPSKTGTTKTRATFTERPRKGKRAETFIDMFPSLSASYARTYSELLKTWARRLESPAASAF